MQSARFNRGNTAIQVLQHGILVRESTMPAHLVHSPHVPADAITEHNYRERTVAAAKKRYDQIVAGYRAAPQPAD